MKCMADSTREKALKTVWNNVVTWMRTLLQTYHFEIILGKYVTLRYVMLHYITLCYVTLCYLTLPYLTLPYLTLPYLTLPYLTLPSEGVRPKTAESVKEEVKDQGQEDEKKPFKPTTLGMGGVVVPSFQVNH